MKPKQSSKITNGSYISITEKPKPNQKPNGYPNI